MGYCECCDHPLEHLIGYVIARYEAPIPPPSASQIVKTLKDGLEDWKEEQEAVRPA